MNSQNYPDQRGARQFTTALLRFGCVAMLLVGALSAQAQTVEMFMKIGGSATTMGANQSAGTLAGESTDPQYTGWNTVLSMSHGVSRAGTNAPPVHSDVFLGKAVDKATPSINLLANGVASNVAQPIDFVTIDFRRAGATPQVFYRIELQGVQITSASVSGASPSSPAESLSLTYTKIRWVYVPYVNGKAQTQVVMGWDVSTQKAF